MSYLAIVKVENNSIAKYESFEFRSDAKGHIDKYGGFVVDRPKSGSMDYWIVDEVAKTITHDSSTEAADKVAYDALAYSRSRKVEYPSIPEQLDYIYHNGVEKWKTDMILPVKEKYPKGDS